MVRRVVSVLDEIEGLLTTELLDNYCDGRRWFDNCETRVDVDAELIFVHDLSFCGRNPSDDVIRVNEELRKSRIEVAFQFDEDCGRVADALHEAIVQFTVKFSYPDVDTPEVFKWESRGTVAGVLKDPDDKTLEEDIDVGAGLRTAMDRHFSTIVPQYGRQSETSELAPRQIQLRYEHETDIIHSLDPYDHEDLIELDGTAT